MECKVKRAAEEGLEFLNVSFLFILKCKSFKCIFIFETECSNYSIYKANLQTFLWTSCLKEIINSASQKPRHILNSEK